ncbi:MAG: amidohydrolase family protein [Candidatus Omnitrophica bacterium]|nr:amidohydrolase family protein [Candidatus Omnitrophota bacterium]
MGRIIDFHAHLGKVIYGYPALTVDKLLKFMDRRGIEKSVILPLVAPEEEDYYYTTEQAVEDCAKHADRLIPFANIDPRRGSNDGAYDFYPVLKEYADMGCRGLGEILANVPANDPRMKALYRACGMLNFPVVFDFRMAIFRTGVPEPAGLPNLEECLREFPGTVFVGHGPAWWAEISADVKQSADNAYPQGKIVPTGRIDYLLEKYPNMYADLSAHSGYNALTRDKDYSKKFMRKHYRKLLFGTDWFVRNEKTLMIDLIRSMKLPEEIEESVFSKNARTLLGI